LSEAFEQPSQWASCRVGLRRAVWAAFPQFYDVLVFEVMSELFPVDDDGVYDREAEVILMLIDWSMVGGLFVGLGSRVR